MAISSLSVDRTSSGCSFVVYGGDALISHCIWSAGYGMTQPIQSYFKPHVQMFDLGRWERRPLMNLLVDATEGNCNELCQAQVGLHISPSLHPLDSTDKHSGTAFTSKQSSTAFTSKHSSTGFTNRHSSTAFIHCFWLCLCMFPCW